MKCPSPTEERNRNKGQERLAPESVQRHFLGGKVINADRLKQTHKKERKLGRGKKMEIGQSKALLDVAVVFFIFRVL